MQMAENTGFFKDKTVFISGGSRGIGLAIAKKLAKDGANIVLAAKTAEPHPKLPGTIFSAAKEIEAVGGKCLPCIVDVRDEKAVQVAVEQAVERFGGIDILINNASAVALSGTLNTSMKSFDLMNTINVRGSFMLSQKCLPYLLKAENPHILNMSPPLTMESQWFKPHTAYTMSKYGMAMVVLGLSAEFKEHGVAVNALWPRTSIYTSATSITSKEKDAWKHCRKEDILADAAYLLLSKPAQEFTGNFVIDDEILAENGVTDLRQYSIDPDSKLTTSFFIPGVQYTNPRAKI
ncbi:Hydroxysteroid dehydrogenase-like protein 2 [Aphelenchoides bicaudatus]|nr:Hydroxysteroid dehydrogenase-like protein 2 [Aphelenchoides bicaudatus]